MKLSKRLETIASMVPESTKDGLVADVGTDHGFVPIWLVEEKRAGRALAMDVRSGPLQRAQEHIREHKLEQAIETRLSDGLEKLKPSEADTVVIAGMGGELMLRILKDGNHVRDTVPHWVLSPQSELREFRHGLEKLGLAIVKEAMVEEDGKYYTIILAEPGKMHYDKEYKYRYGEYLIRTRSSELAAFLKKEERQYNEIISRLKQQPGEAARSRLDEITRNLEELKEACEAMRGESRQMHQERSAEKVTYKEELY